MVGVEEGLFLSLSLLFWKCHYMTWTERSKLIVQAYIMQNRLRLRAQGIMIWRRNKLKTRLSKGGEDDQCYCKFHFGDEMVRRAGYYHKWVSSHMPCNNNMVGLVFIWLISYLALGYIYACVSHVRPLRRLCYLGIRI